jgi:hypothetical protein
MFLKADPRNRRKIDRHQGEPLHRGDGVPATPEITEKESMNQSDKGLTRNLDLAGGGQYGPRGFQG